MSAPIATVLRIDVEPDTINACRRSAPWRGFVAMNALVDRLRSALGDRSGHIPHPTWMFRFDPHIEHCFGRVDFVVERHRDVVEALRERRDPFGIHVHPYRWREHDSVLFSEHCDSHWITGCLNTASETFARRFEEPARRMSVGGYFLNEPLIDAAVAIGIRVDVTIEPGLPPRQADPSFGAYATAPTPDYRLFPRSPYYPSRGEMWRPASTVAEARPILMVPLTAYDYKTARRRWPRRLLATVFGRTKPIPLNPWKPWPTPKAYWDLVMRAADEQQARYAALAVRTDDPASESHRRVHELLDYLPQHPISRRLWIVDPLGPEIGAIAVPRPM